MIKRKGLGKGIVDIVSALYLVSIAVTGTVSITAGSTTNLTATATFSNGATVDVTSTAVWTTSDAAMATVTGGVVTGVKLTARVVITASLGAVSGTANCSVHVSFASVSAGAWTQIWGLTLTRASSATVRNGDSAVIVSGIGVNVARVGRRLNSDAMGLLLEITRTNNCKTNNNPTSASWTVGTAPAPTYPSGTTPDGGGTQGCLWNVTNPQYSRYHTTAASTGVTFTYSMWAQGPAAITAQWQTGALTPAYSLTTAWQRIIGSHTTTGVQHYLTPAITATQVSRTWGHQIEVGFFETSLIINNTSGSVTRADERLTCTTTITVANRVNIGWKLNMLGSSAQYKDNSTAVLAYADANNNIIWNTTTGVCTITADGATNTFALGAWSKYSSVELYVGAGGGTASVAKIRVNAGAVTTLAITGSALASFVASSLDWLCNNTTLQTSAWINEMYLEVPAWAV
jgi:hypothetical protein